MKSRVAVLLCAVLTLTGMAVSYAQAQAARLRQSDHAPTRSHQRRVSTHSPRIVVKKRLRRLLLYSGSRLVRTYNIALGPHPDGDKSREGDGCTPEGDFYIAGKNPRSHYFMSLLVSYPGLNAAQRGLSERRITRAQYKRITTAIRRGRTPPQDTPLGGQVFVHGGGSSRDWTLGCIALDNAAMRELFAVSAVGTPVRIEP